MVEKIMNDPGLNKLLLGVIIALLSWNVYTTQQLTVDVAVLKTIVASLQEKMSG